jgi:hypothetical protein
MGDWLLAEQAKGAMGARQDGLLTPWEHHLIRRAALVEMGSEHLYCTCTMSEGINEQMNE